MPATVTVIVPTRNRIQLLPEAVASVKSQAHAEWELVIVDDCSEDATSEWLRELHDDRVRNLRMDRHGERSRTRNRGLAASSADHVLFLDDDDRLAPRALERLSTALESAPGAVAAIGARMMFDEKGARRRPAHPRLASRRHVWFDVLFGWTPIPGQCLLDRGALLTAGGWNERLHAGEDQDLWLRLMRLGPVAIVPHVTLENRFHPGQWRPEDVPALNEGLRRESLSRLSPPERSRAERVLQARELRRAGGKAYRAERFREALSAYLGALREHPRLLTSPLWGPHMLAGVGKSALGLLGSRKLLRGLRTSKQLLWTRLGRGSMGDKDIRTVPGRRGRRR
ncbi:MAG: glycosyltransferase family 2 protein [Actinomycetota bacterium]